MLFPNSDFITLSFLYLSIGLLAFNGFGVLLSNYFLQFQKLHFGINTCIGFSLFLCACGYIDLFKLGGPQFFVVCYLLGLSLVLAYIFFNKNLFINFRLLLQFKSGTLARPYLFIGTIVLIAGYIFLYLLNLCFFPFNEGDDFQGYLVLAKRILEEGYQGGDVFNLRAIVQGFGGGNYINAFFMSLMPIKWIHMAEAGTGLVLLIILTVNEIWNKNKYLWQCVYGSVCVCIYAIFIPIVNITPILSGAACALAILIVAHNSSENFSWRTSFLLGLLAAGLTLLKGTFVVTAIIFCGAYYFARILSLQSFWVLKELVIAITSFLILLVPWAFTNLYYFDTLFYPLLGVGLVSSGGFGFAGTEIFLDNLYQYHPLYLLTLSTWLLLICHERYEKRLFINILLVFYFCGTIILALTPGGGFRYNFILLSIPSLFYLIEYFSISDKKITINIIFFSESQLRKFLIFIIVITSILMLNQVKRVGGQLFEKGLYARLLNPEHRPIQPTDPISSNYSKQRDLYSELQNMIPANTTAIVAVEYPYLFNFSRNHLYVSDIPGTTGFKPGMPFQGTPENLRQYLLSNEIRYVIHTYKGWAEINDFHEMHSKIEWVRNQVIRYFAVNKQLLGFIDFLKPVFDNGSERVFDLCMANINPASVCNN